MGVPCYDYSMMGFKTLSPYNDPNPKPYRSLEGTLKGTLKDPFNDPLNPKPEAKLEKVRGIS